MDDLKRAELIRVGLASEFWREIIRPMFEARRLAMNAALRNPDTARKAKLPDDYIRGRLEECELLLDQPALLRDSLEHAAIEERLTERREHNDDLRGHHGIGWMGDAGAEDDEIGLQ